MSNIALKLLKAVSAICFVLGVLGFALGQNLISSYILLQLGAPSVVFVVHFCARKALGITEPVVSTAVIAPCCAVSIMTPILRYTHLPCSTYYILLVLTVSICAVCIQQAVYIVNHSVGNAFLMTVVPASIVVAIFNSGWMVPAATAAGAASVFAVATAVIIRRGKQDWLPTSETYILSDDPFVR